MIEVLGDVIRIKLDEVVPADVRFIDGDYISIDQSALTGESLPVSKKRFSKLHFQLIRKMLQVKFWKQIKSYPVR